MIWKVRWIQGNGKFRKPMILNSRKFGKGMILKVHEGGRSNSWKGASGVSSSLQLSFTFSPESLSSTLLQHCDHDHHHDHHDHDDDNHHFKSARGGQFWEGAA